MHEAVCRQLFDDAAKGIGPELCTVRGWVIHRAEYPLMEVGFTGAGRQNIRIRAHCDSWNGIAPSIEWLDAIGNPLSAIPQGPGGQLNSSAHPQTGRPFVCMAGVREYHTHPSHLGDTWESYRSRPGYDLGGILTQVWRAWQQARP